MTNPTTPQRSAGNRGGASVPPRKGLTVIVQGTTVTEEQQRAARAAMIGEFTAADVRHALAMAGIRSTGTDYLNERVADRIMQKERRAGRIEAVTNKLWRTK